MKLRKHLLTAAIVMALGISAGAYAAEAPEENQWGACLPRRHYAEH